METLYFLGIDISKKTLDACLNANGTILAEMNAENNQKGIKKMFGSLKRQFKINPSQLMVCVENTGIYNLPILHYLIKAGIRVCVESALQIKQSQGLQRGKNDKIDARRIASYAFKNQKDLRLWKPQRSVIQKLKELLTVRERLVRVRVQLQKPIKENDVFMEKSIKNVITGLYDRTLRSISADIVKVENAIDGLLKEDQKLAEQFKCASSVPGVGKIIALNVIVATGEFEMISDIKKFACYAGVAPFEHSSGSSIRGKTRVSKMANMSMKTLLHLGARSAITCCDELKTYYHRKVNAGKNKMSVLNAVSNKLISRIFVCVKNQRIYEKNYQRALA